MSPNPSDLIPGELPIKAFVSSVMSLELDWARSVVVAALHAPSYLVPWAFEFTPSSSEPVDESYLRHVRESDMVIWLVSSEVTEPVRREIREALASRRRLLVFRLRGSTATDATEALLKEVSHWAKWMLVSATEDGLRSALELTLRDEIVRALRGKPGMGRLARLEELGRASRARCIARWKSVG